MGTVTITSAAFAALPGTVPKNWPSNLTWPAGGSINGTKPFTISDADIQQMLSWIATNYNSTLVGTSTPPVTVTAISMFLVWLVGFMNATTDAVQHHQTDPAVKPPPITIS
jgi:hypothetical protein